MSDGNSNKHKVAKWQFTLLEWGIGVALASTVLWYFLEPNIVNIFTVLTVGPYLGALVGRRNGANAVSYGGACGLLIAVGMFSIAWAWLLFEYAYHIGKRPYFEDGVVLEGILIPLVLLGVSGFAGLVIGAMVGLVVQKR